MSPSFKLDKFPFFLLSIRLNSTLPVLSRPRWLNTQVPSRCRPLGAGESTVKEKIDRVRNSLDYVYTHLLGLVYRYRGRVYRLWTMGTPDPHKCHHRVNRKFLVWSFLWTCRGPSSESQWPRSLRSSDQVLSPYPSFGPETRRYRGTGTSEDWDTTFDTGETQVTVPGMGQSKSTIFKGFEQNMFFVYF